MNHHVHKTPDGVAGGVNHLGSEDRRQRDQ